MPRKRQQDIEASPHPDGLREGVMNDPTGAQHGIIQDTDAVNPQAIAEIRKQSMTNKPIKEDREKGPDLT